MTHLSERVLRSSFVPLPTLTNLPISLERGRLSVTSQYFILFFLSNLVVYDNVVWIDIFYIIMLYMFLWCWKRNVTFFFLWIKEEKDENVSLWKDWLLVCVLDDALILDCNCLSGGLISYFLVVPKWRDLVFIISIMHDICICVVPVWRVIVIFCVDALVVGYIRIM